MLLVIQCVSCDQSVCNLELDRKYGCVCIICTLELLLTILTVLFVIKSIIIKVWMDFRIELVITSELRLIDHRCCEQLDIFSVSVRTKRPTRC